MTLTLEGRTTTGLAVPPLVVPGGAVVCLTGPSGAGKTRLLRAIADLDSSALRISLDGTAMASVPAPTWRRRVAYLAPVPGWIAERAGANLADEAAATPLLATLGFNQALLSRPVRELSTGQQQRLHLVRLLERAPEVLLLDEPTSALDPAVRDAAEAVIQARAETGAVVILTTHDATAIDRLGARHWRIEDGEVVEA